MLNFIETFMFFCFLISLYVIFFPLFSEDRRTPMSKKVDAYKSLPMSQWEFKDVAHFLIEAIHDLGIRYEDANFSLFNYVDGKKLASMTVKDFESFAQQSGEKVYHYVQQHNLSAITSSGKQFSLEYICI